MTSAPRKDMWSRFLTPEEKAIQLARWEALKAEFADALAAGELLMQHEDGSKINVFGEDLSGRGFPDPETYALCDELNTIEGICTIQSCSGHRVAYAEDGTVMANGEVVGPTLWAAQLWLRLSRPMRDLVIERGDMLKALPGIERVQLMFADWGDTLDIVFDGLNAGADYADGLRKLQASGRAIREFLKRMEAIAP